MNSPAKADHEGPQIQRTAVGEMFAQHHKALFRTAYRILRSKEDAEDAVQTAYCNALRAIHALRDKTYLKSWITRIVVNCCLAQMRQRRARRELGLEEADNLCPLLESQSVTPETLWGVRELQLAHANAASQLPRRLHDVYVRCTVLGASVNEVARDLGLTVAASKSRLHRARGMVEQTLSCALRGRAA